MTAQHTTGVWFSVGTDGNYYQCGDEQLAKRLADDNDEAWPEDAPHRAVQLVDAAALDAMQAQRDELLSALKPFAVYGRPGSKDVEVGAAIAAIAKAEGETQ